MSNKGGSTTMNGKKTWHVSVPLAQAPMPNEQSDSTLIGGSASPYETGWVVAPEFMLTVLALLILSCFINFYFCHRSIANRPWRRNPGRKLVENGDDDEEMQALRT